MNKFILNCYVHGNVNGRVFSVKIDKAEPIDFLKPAIWEEKRNAYQDLDSKDPDIWKVQFVPVRAG